MFLTACYASANFRGLEALCDNFRIHEENSFKYGGSIKYEKAMHLLDFGFHGSKVEATTGSNMRQNSALGAIIPLESTRK